MAEFDNQRYNFKYLANSKHGQYYFYYNPKLGRLQYVFKYWNLPKFGVYVFQYEGSLPMKIERDEVLLKLEEKKKMCNLNNKEKRINKIYSYIDKIKEGIFDLSLDSNSKTMFYNTNAEQDNHTPALLTSVKQDVKNILPFIILDKNYSGKEIDVSDESDSNGELKSEDKDLINRVIQKDDILYEKIVNYLFTAYNNKQVKNIIEKDMDLEHGVVYQDHPKNREVDWSIDILGEKVVGSIGDINEKSNRETKLNKIKKELKYTTKEQRNLTTIKKATNVFSREVLDFEDKNIEKESYKILKPTNKKIDIQCDIALDFVDKVVTNEKEFVLKPTKNLVDIANNSYLKQTKREINKEKVGEKYLSHDKAKKTDISYLISPKGIVKDKKQYALDLEKTKKFVYKDNLLNYQESNEYPILKGDRGKIKTPPSVNNIVKHEEMSLQNNSKGNGSKEGYVGLKKDELNFFISNSISFLEKDTKKNYIDTQLKRMQQGSKNITFERLKRMQQGSKNILIHNKKNNNSLEKEKKRIKYFNEQKKLDKQEKEVKKELEEYLDLYKRFWFLNQEGETDSKILPNIDSPYPPSIEVFDMMESQGKGVYHYKYNIFVKKLSGFVLRCYNDNLAIISQQQLIVLKEYYEKINNTELKISIEKKYTSDLNTGDKNVKKDNSEEIQDDVFLGYLVDIEINSWSEDLSYMSIAQPNINGEQEYVFIATEKYLNINHPIPLGEDLGITEFPIQISIMVDFLNIMLLVWSKRYLAFSGWMGSQAIKGFVNVIYDWVTLDSSLDEDYIEDYHRCYRWLRWEAEKVYNKAKLDTGLNGNIWIENIFIEMIKYMEMHHFDTMFIWEDIDKMDEQRNIFSEPDIDISITLDKVKGIRKKILQRPR